MTEKIKIGVIGRISNKLCDGQTVKTRILVNELQNHYNNCEIILAETYNYKAHPLKLLIQLFRCIKQSDVIFVLLSRNGIRVVFPIIHILNRLYKKPVFHDCIGGSLAEFITEKPYLKKYVKGFTINWVETELLKNKLQAIDIHNVAVLPNFKPLESMSENELHFNDSKPYRFCTFSRVIREKGITAAAEAIIGINRERNSNIVTLDIYGPIEGDYSTELNELISRSDGAVCYKGVVDYRDSVQILRDYYMLLFPTYHTGEGFPGTLIDAFSAGLPVIATDWNCNSEIISDKTTGFLYPNDEPHRLKKLIEEAIASPKMIYEMRKNCLIDVQHYSAETVMETVYSKIEEVLSK